MIMPRSGRIAWNCLLQPCLAEPPARSPSTMRISPPSAIASAVIRRGALGGYSVRDDLPSDVVRGGPMVAGRDRLDLASFDESSRRSSAEPGGGPVDKGSA
jgi:hypothetical protein